jgi:hypothetical protein
METTKKNITIFILLAFIGCKDKYYIGDSNLYVNLSSSELRHIKENLYLLNNKEYIILTNHIVYGQNSNNEFETSISGKEINDKAFNYKKNKTERISDILNVNTYTSVIKNIVYKDLNNVYYINNSSLGYIPDRAVNILDLIPEKLKIINNEYFIDDKNIYYLNLKLNLNVNKIKFNKFYIKDDQKVYWQGVLVENADAPSFENTTLEDTVDYSLYQIGKDNKNLYWNWNPYNYEEFEELRINKKIKDSLSKIYFSTH